VCWAVHQCESPPSVGLATVSVTDELYALMRSAPTTRRFSDEPVAREALERVLDAARFAPSGGNRQGWRVIVVTDRQLRTALRELYLPHWQRYTEVTGIRDALRSEKLPANRRSAIETADRYAETLDQVPVHLVICVELSTLAITDAELPRPSLTGGGSIYPFVQNVLLGLRAEGLGAAFTTLLVPAEAEVRELLAIPDGVALAGHIAVGHRRGPWPQELARNPVADFTFGDRYGSAW
jgi:nitroreductase